ncbi:MAG TPA: hypothetical protein VK816_04675 [Jatrophihabitantaceae bacterium]|jgi:hypothetical protein|nr:hypothetical protein [Jatrophihabitantaceae bacterium]
MSKTKRQKKAKPAIHWIKIDEESFDPPTEEEMWESLTGSSFHLPRPAVFTLRESSGNSGVDTITLEVAITSIRAHYDLIIETFEEVTPAKMVSAPSEYPDLKYEGWVIPSGFSPLAPVVLVRGSFKSWGNRRETLSHQLELSRPLSTLSYLATVPELRRRRSEQLRRVAAVGEEEDSRCG